MREFSVRFFAPLLAGASLRDRLIACLGAFVGIALAGLSYSEISPLLSPIYVAPIGASAVLLFAVPSSPLAQPWSIIGGNTVSMIVGLLVSQLGLGLIGGAALAVSAAILVMSLLRCLHPPGGAVALSAILSGPMLSATQCSAFAVPVVLNSVLLVVIGWFFHRYSGHSYPHRPVPVMWKEEITPEPRARVTLDDIDKALEDLGETFDVSREDLALLLERAEVHAARRGGIR